MSQENSLRAFDVAVLAVGVLAVSTAALLIRETDAPSMVIAAARVTLASLPLLFITGIKRQNPLSADRKLFYLTVLSGVFLALHFGFWVASVQQTSIVTSVVLVTTAPVFVGLAGEPLLGEKPGPALWLALAISAAGTLLMVSEDFGSGGDTLAGDAYALLGGVLAAGFLIAGRRVLAGGASWLAYSTVNYSTAAILLLAGALLTGESLGGYSDRTYLYLVLLALVPQLIGHTALNRSLGHVPAIVVALVVLGEPVAATILAAIFLGEDPTLVQLTGGVIVLTGVAIGVRGGVGSNPQIVAELG
jgi:drug/metabolite transporter (DMT)-like permease